VFQILTDEALNGEIWVCDGGAEGGRAVRALHQLLVGSSGCHVWPAIDAANGGEVADT
jgi:hypothetical protein